ncbi:hypothetical protein LguiA_020454 [Lonicera macranthoides]
MTFVSALNVPACGTSSGAPGILMKIEENLPWSYSHVEVELATCNGTPVRSWHSGSGRWNFDEDYNVYIETAVRLLEMVAVACHD